MRNNLNNKNNRVDTNTQNQGFGIKFTDGATRNFKPQQQARLNIILSTIKAAKDDSENPAGCLTNFYSILCSSYLVIVSLVLFTCLPVAMLAIGIVHLNNCPLEPKIPVWLIVLGITGLINCLIRLTTSIIIQLRFRKGKSVIFHEPLPIFLVTTLIGIFIFIWFCLGNAWVFNVKSTQQSNDKSSNTYCNQICYDFAFWSIISLWIVVCLIFLFLVGLALYFIIGLLNRIIFNRRVNLSNVR